MRDAIERAVPFEKPVRLGSGISFRLVPAGHILGAAIVALEAKGKRGRLVFTGDLGRLNDPIMRPPSTVRETDYLVVESTYGNRPAAADELRRRIEEELHWTCEIPDYLARATLT